jgi:hypothetical protein
MPLSSGPALSTREGSSATTCLTTPCSALPSQGESSGAATCPMVLSGPWTTGIKKRLNSPRHAARLACSQGTLAHYQDACKTCGHDATVQHRTTDCTQVQLAGDVTGHDGTVPLTVRNVARTTRRGAPGATQVIISLLLAIELWLLEYGVNHPESACNYLALCYKGTGQPPILAKSFQVSATLA